MINYWKLLKTMQIMQTFPCKELKYIQAFQLSRFNKLIHHAYERIPMYKEFYDSHGFKPAMIHNYEDTEKVPIITRDFMQNYPLQKRIDDRVSENNVYKKRTSGSTGQPLEIWFDKTDYLIRTLKVIRYLRAWGYSPFYNTIRLWGGSEPKNSFVQKLGIFKNRDIDIVGQPAKAMDEVSKSSCEVLFATRSSLEAFADELDKGNVVFRPRILVSTGEMLMEEHRQRFKEKFGCHTVNVYGTEEMGNIAWECPDQHYNLHTSMETILINFGDIVTQSNGKTGSIIVTNLENYVMPFIRYKQADKILIPENDQCPCGRTLSLLGKLFGRNEDVLEYKGRKYYWNFFYNIMEKKNFQYIKKYKIVQTKNGSIQFRIQLIQNDDETRKKCISDLNSAYKNHFSLLDIKFVDKFKLQANRKFKILEKEM